MWSDNETDRDFLNFSGVSETVAELIVRAEGKPISIGVSGAWGVGKSSMIKMIRRSLSERDTAAASRFVFVEFNAWLYQGYDDARAALLEVVAKCLEAEATKTQTGLEKAKAFLGRVNWFRVAKLVAPNAIALSLGLPPVGFLGTLAEFGSQWQSGSLTSKAVADAGEAANQALSAGEKTISPPSKDTPPEQIEELRKLFQETLRELNIVLVVLIDDLDRCLPETAISTLEAIRLLLFLDRAAFVIAADDAMIKHAVKRHFDGVDDRLATNYFDKLIQIPIRVPPLGTQEVRAYMLLLYVEASDLGQDVKDEIREKVCTRLRETWQGKRVDRAYIETLHGEKFESSLVAQLDTADRLAPLMVSAPGLQGNPRLIKRFLNALQIRMTVSRAHGVGVDEAVLAKMMLFERLGDSALYGEIATAVLKSDDGRAHFLSDLEAKILADRDAELKSSWSSRFAKDWLALPPQLSDKDLRGVLYVSREHAPLITLEDRLSSTGAELLKALLESPAVAGSAKDALKRLPILELNVILDRLLERARQEQSWGTPPILEACLVVASVDVTLGERFAAFLADRPARQITTALIPKIADQPWSPNVFEKWRAQTGIREAVARAIEQHGASHGNICI